MPGVRGDVVSAGEFSPCRSCRRQVRWAKTAKTGKPMPLDESPERGNVLLDAIGQAHVFKDRAAAMAAVEGRPEEFGVTDTTFISHHAEGQCPHGRAWQGKRRGDVDEPKPPKPAKPVQESLIPHDPPANAITAG